MDWAGSAATRACNCAIGKADRYVIRNRDSKGRSSFRASARSSWSTLPAPVTTNTSLTSGCSAAARSSVPPKAGGAKIPGRSFDPGSGRLRVGREEHHRRIPEDLSPILAHELERRVLDRDHDVEPDPPVLHLEDVPEPPPIVSVEPPACDRDIPYRSRDRPTGHAPESAAGRCRSRRRAARRVSPEYRTSTSFWRVCRPVSCGGVWARPAITAPGAARATTAVTAHTAIRRRDPGAQERGMDARARRLPPTRPPLTC